MLDRYLKTEATLLPIKFIDENYFVDIRGNFYRSDSSGFVVIDTASNTIDVTINGIPYTVSVYNIMQMTWKPVFVEDTLFYLMEADVIFTDHNPRNRHPLNLIWKLKDNSFGDKFRIPGFSRYLMDVNLNIHDRLKNDIVKITYENGRYVSCNISPDYAEGRSVWYVVHRIVAYTFVEYREDVCRLDVNHIDGDKWNFKVDNLEFTTRRGNNIHAVKMQLKQDANNVVVTDVINGSVTKYVSQAVCAKELNICVKLLSWRLRNGADRVWDGRYKFEVIKGENSLKKYQSEPKKVVIRNSYTGEVVHFDSLRKASEFLNVKYDALKKRVSRNSTVFGDWELKAYNPRLGEECPVF